MKEKVENYKSEQEAAEGLDICGYSGKWKKAKASQKDGSLYWYRVRIYFLELGGCYLSERCNCSGKSENQKPDGGNLFDYLPTRAITSSRKTRFA